MMIFIIVSEIKLGEGYGIFILNFITTFFNFDLV